MITEDRIEELKRRGVKTDLLLSDWCLYCVHNKEIIKDGFTGICRTGCNGFPPFEIENSIDGSGKKIFKRGKFPLRYKKENGIDISL